MYSRGAAANTIAYPL